MDADNPFDLLPPAAAAFARKPHANLIGAGWVSPASGEMLDLVDPGTGDVVGHMPACAAADIDLAVTQAQAALQSGPWSRMTGLERGRPMWKPGGLIGDTKIKGIVARL